MEIAFPVASNMSVLAFLQFFRVLFYTPMHELPQGIGFLLMSTLKDAWHTQISLRDQHLLERSSIEENAQTKFPFL
jgi:hypothetical protein